MKLIAMKEDPKTSFINLENLLSFSMDDPSRILKYLNQFQELIPERLKLLSEALKLEDRKQIRQILHKMSPQLQFFGIQNINIPIQRLEFEYTSMPFFELEALVNDIIFKLEGAIKEVSKIIESHFE